MSKAEDPPNLDTLAKNLRAELDQLGPQRAALVTQVGRINKRMRYLSKMLGIPMPTYRDRAKGNKIETIKRLLREAKSPMSVDSIMRELQVAGPKDIYTHQRVAGFLARHPREFVSVGENVWDLAPRWETPKS